MASENLIIIPPEPEHCVNSLSDQDQPPLSTEIHPIEEEHEVEEDVFIQSYLTIKLYQAALSGDLETVLRICRDQQISIRAKITKGGDTVLHIAAASKHLHIVQELVKVMDHQSLSLKNRVGNTAFCFAAVSGDVEMAKVMVKKFPRLPDIRGSDGMTPLLMAIFLGHKDMAWYLMSVTDHTLLTPEDNIELVTCAIDTNLYDIAKHMVRYEKDLTVWRDAKEETALHALARKPPLRLDRTQLSMWQKFKGYNITLTEPQDMLELTQALWDKIIRLKHEEVSNLLCSPWRLLFVAAELGKVQFLMLLIKSYPDIIWKVDENRYSIFHIAVLHRHEEIFKLIYELGAIKDLIATYKDDNGNNILHLASKLAPFDRLNSISGAALQMQWELLWFEAVKKIVRPEYAEAKNKDNKTPRALFSEEHEGLRRKGEEWMKKTAESCALVATLIATVIFSAAFQLPGGTDDKGNPILGNRISFVVFAIANAISLFTSTASILMFLSILTSPYAQTDFLVSLPLKLMRGLILLLVSIASMMVAFTATFFITFKERMKWAPIPIALFASIPVMLFAFQQFPLLVDIYHSTYKSDNIFQPGGKILFTFPSHEDVNATPTTTSTTLMVQGLVYKLKKNRSASTIVQPLGSAPWTG